MPGMILGGRYQVQDKIGTGGMATVFRGLDEVLGRTVAIKTMLPQYAADPSFAARFKQEAQAAAALQSPYIVSVYDWGKDADTYYIVMEYLRGTDLKSGIRKHGALDCKKVAQIGSQIAQALSVAHRHDIKPQNIMVQPDGNIKVMDFGIARAKNSHLTQDNSVLGTAHYVSPEQTQGKELGPTTDIYSLGIVMYEAATGQVPFQGDDAITVALKQVNEQPKPPSQLNPSVDPALESIILKCMQKNPADRFQTADELYRTLRDYLAGRVQAVNSATAMLPVQPTNKLERGTGAIPATGGTASIPRVERTNRYRAQSATEQAAEEEAGRQRRHRRNVILAVIGVIAVVAVAAVALFSIFGSGTQTKPVPNLIGLTQEQAIQEIENNGFEVGKVEQGYTSAQEEGLVYEQSPLATRAMPEGSSIDIRVSKGEAPAEKVTVPDLTNLPEDQVEAELAKYNLVGRKGEDQESDSIEKGRVCSQDTPEGTEVNVGETITYHISSGASTAVIPNVVGDYYEDAQERLSSSDGEFDVKVVWDYSNTVAEGNVISVDPAAGNTAEVGSTVTITVSSGPKPVENVSVPPVVGMSYYDARAQLQNLGFVVQLASGSSAEGVVVNQSAWESLPSGSTIVLTTEVQSTGNENGGSGTGSNGGGSSTGDNQGDTGNEESGASGNSRSSSRQRVSG